MFSWQDIISVTERVPVVALPRQTRGVVADETSDMDPASSSSVSEIKSSPLLKSERTSESIHSI